jgi:uncharacterized protein
MSDQGLSRPLPKPDDLSRPFFDGARRHALMIQRCKNCGTHQLPGRFVCDECFSENLEWTEASGRGTVFSYVVVHQRYHPAFAEKVPYNVAVVELEEGPRLTTTIADVDNEDVRVRMPVEVGFEDVNEEISLPYFRPASQ